MNSKNECGAVDLLIVAVMMLAWATWQVVRLTAVPLVGLLLVLLTPRRRPAPQSAAAAPAPASPEAPAPMPAADEAVESEPVLAPTLATIAADLMALPAAELRRLAGTRRRLPKRELTALICALPI